MIRDNAALQGRLRRQHLSVERGCRPRSDGTHHFPGRLRGARALLCCRRSGNKACIPQDTHGVRFQEYATRASARVCLPKRSRGRIGPPCKHNFTNQRSVLAPRSSRSMRSMTKQGMRRPAGQILHNLTVLGTTRAARLNKRVQRGHRQCICLPATSCWVLQPQVSKGATKERQSLHNPGIIRVR